MNIAKFCISHKVATILAVIMITIFGGIFTTQLQMALMPLLRALFSDVNPIPVKAALSMLGRAEDNLRLPLVPLDEIKRSHLKKEMEALRLI